MIASRISDKQWKWTVDQVHPESSLAGSIGMKQTCKSYAAGDGGCEDSYLDLEKSGKHNKTKLIAIRFDCDETLMELLRCLSQTVLAPSTYPIWQPMSTNVFVFALSFSAPRRSPYENIKYCDAYNGPYGSICRVGFRQHP
jgi:hypothetical protein